MPAPPPPRRAAPAPADTAAAHVAALGAALDALAAAEIHVRPAIDALATEDRLEELLALLGRLDDLALMAEDWKRRASNAAAEIVPAVGEKYPMPGGGTFRVSTSAQKKHIDGAGVIKATAEALADTLLIREIILESGEVAEPGPLLEGVVRTVAKISGASGEKFAGWRVTPLEELGVSLSRFTTWEDGPTKPVIEDRHP